jgi:hypothetical protein
MKKLTIIVCFLLFSLVENVSAQNNINVSIGGGYITSPINSTKLPYWGNGYSINISSDYEFSKNISFFFSTSYQEHTFNEKLLFIVVPHVVGYRYSVNGENSSLIEISFGSKFYTNHSKIQPYLGVGAGLLLINQGKVEIISWMEGSSYKSTSKYPDTDKNYNLFQVNFGLGLEIELINNFQIVLDGRFINSFEGPSYFPITASIKFGI